MKIIFNKLDKPVNLYLDKSTIQGIMKEFSTMGVVVDNLEKKDKDEIASDGIIVNSYSNIDDEDIINNEYTYMVGDKVIYTYSTRKNDSLVVRENNETRFITGYDNELYKLNAEYFNIGEQIYSAFPSYKIKCDGSIETVEGSALDNLKKLRAKHCKVKTK